MGDYNSSGSNANRDRRSARDQRQAGAGDLAKKTFNRNDSGNKRYRAGSGRDNEQREWRHGKSSESRGRRESYGREDNWEQRGSSRRAFGDSRESPRRSDRGSEREGARGVNRSGGARSPRRDRYRDGDRQHRGYSDRQRSYGDRPRGERREFGGPGERWDSGSRGERREWRSNDGRPAARGNWKARGERNNRSDARGERRSAANRDFKNSQRGSRGRGQDAQSRSRGGTRGAGRSDRGGSAREFTEQERIAHALRPVRDKHQDPQLPDAVKASDLHPAARNELKTLEKENAELVGRHLAMVAELLESDPQLAHEHAISASRRAGRIPVVRETLALTAYSLGDFGLALRELRTYKRLSGRIDHTGLMIDCERGLGRPERALELAREIDSSNLEDADRARYAIAVSGAYLDLNKPLLAQAELEKLNFSVEHVYDYSPEVFRAYAAVLETNGDAEQAEKWEFYADHAVKALHERAGGDQLEVIETLASQEELAASGVLDELRAEAAALREAAEAAGAAVAAPETAGEALSSEDSLETAGSAHPAAPGRHAADTAAEPKEYEPAHARADNDAV